MKKLILFLLLFFAAALLIAQRQTLTSTVITGITGLAQIDNRASIRANTQHTFCATGSGTWSVTIQHKDGAGSWISFTNPNNTVSNLSSTCYGIGLGYHDYIRFNGTGTFSVDYSGTKLVFLGSPIGSGAAGSGILTLNGLNATAQTYNNDTNVTISSAGSAHTLGWSGTLAKARIVGTAVYNDQANTYSAGLQDFTSGTFKISNVAGAVPTVDATISFNTTTHALVWGSNGVTIVGAVAATGTNTNTTCTNQVITAISAIAIPTCSTITSAFTSGTFTATAHNLLSAIHGDTTTASAVRGDGVFAIGATPTWQRLAHSSTTGGYFKWNGTDIVASTLAAAGTGGCTNQVVSAANADAAPTCHTVVGADFGSAIAARTVFGNNTASAAAPGFNTTADALAYQTAEIPAFAFVTVDFTTSGVGTALEAITGLTWTVPASTAINIPFKCNLIYHQNAGNDVVTFGIQQATNAPTQINASGVIYTSTTANVAGNLVALASTTATAIVAGTPSAITTNWIAEVNGMIEAASSGSSSAVTIRVSTNTAGDTVTVKRGSFCRMN